MAIRTKAKPEHYVNNKEFLEAMKAYKKSVNVQKEKKETNHLSPIT